VLTEKRKHARCRTRFRCWCEGDNVTVFGRVGNLGEGGLFLHTGTPLQAGAQAKLRLNDPGGQGEALETMATVVWVRGPHHHFPAGMGLKFESMDERNREVVRALIRTASAGQVGIRERP
jgi:uncharacterized protein (TIGR02266 family)